MQTRLALTLLGLLPLGALGADADERLRHYMSMSLEELMDQKVSISTHTSQSLSDAPSVVTVITAEDIKATGATNLADALQGVPGIYVQRSQFAFRPLVRFRGANDKQTLVMINGAPMSDLMWRLGIFWKGLPTSVIDRIEIIRGPGSALFGTDASAGVINVITKTAGTIKQSAAGLRVGSFDSQSAWLQYGSQWLGFDVALTADLSRTDGHDPTIVSDAQTSNDSATGSNASLAPGEAGFGWQNTDLRLSLARAHWRLMIDYTRHDDLEIGLTGAGALDPLTEGRDSRFNVDLLYDNPHFGDQLAVNAELRYRHIDYSSGQGFQEWPPGFIDVDPDNAVADGLYPDGVLNRMSSAEHSVIAELSGLYRGIADHAIRIGAGVRWQDIYRVEQQVNAGVDGSGDTLQAGVPLVDLSDTPYAFAPERSRTVRYLYLQDVWHLAEHWELTAGARYDDHSDFGDTWNPRLALVWQTTDRLTTKLLYGEAFRAPYFQELFAETSFTLPNPALEPEKSDTWELSLAYAASSELHLGLALYRFRQRDFISPQPVAGLPKPQYQNSGEHVIRGVELEAWWQPSDALRLAANYSINDPDDSLFRAFGAPERQAYLRADWQFLPNWHWNTQANWIGERGRRPGDTRPAVDDYLLTDTTLRYMGGRDWELAVSVRNLFDADARDYTRSSIANDLPLPGRSLYLEARYHLDGRLR
jgi:iron complex outermembrane receptor protein